MRLTSSQHVWKSVVFRRPDQNFRRCSPRTPVRHLYAEQIPPRFAPSTRIGQFKYEKDRIHRTKRGSVLEDLRISLYWRLFGAIVDLGGKGWAFSTAIHNLIYANNPG